MPYRPVLFANNEIYHTFNRGVNKQPIFWDDRDYMRAVDSMVYYSFINPQIRYSHLKRLLVKQRAQVWADLRASHQVLVDVIAFVLMPNHYHLLLRQQADRGVSRFLANWQNSYGKYVNTKYERVGHLFQGRFKAVRVETNAQLLHVSRYIHLNPHTSLIVSEKEELEKYIWSSFPEYLGFSEFPVCKKEIILDQFKDLNAYKTFVYDQAAYQHSLKRMRDAFIEN